MNKTNEILNLIDESAVLKLCDSHMTNVSDGDFEYSFYSVSE